VTRLRCRKCPYIYDPRLGDPDGGIAPGTPFARIPESWRCPVCGASKRDFVAIDTIAEARQSQPQSVAAPLAKPAAAAVVAVAAPRAIAEWTVGSLKPRPGPS
jgi:rubredoxin